MTRTHKIITCILAMLLFLTAIAILLATHNTKLAWYFITPGYLLLLTNLIPG